MVVRVPAITVRPCTAAHVEALVLLPVANVRAHLTLDPTAYPVPDTDAV
jgi:hypothetical protein